VAPSVLGIHHVTAIAGDPQQNVDFYTQVLGLRLVKVTVDVHDPEAYHLFYGTGTGQPGTLLTFHCWPGAVQGRPGTGQVHGTELIVPPESLEYWHDRLRRNSVAIDGSNQRDGVPSLCFRDPDGLVLELVADDAVLTRETPGLQPIPVDRAIRGLHGVTVWAESIAGWERLLADALGLEVLTEETRGRSYSVPGGRLGAHIGVRVLPDADSGLTAVGYVHHTAFRVSDGALDDWWYRLSPHADVLGPADDHVYYRAVHLEGPEGIRLELASDGPGVGSDEPPAELGTRLALPSWLEERRPDLERRLPPLRLPGADLSE
jgi:glyoxalase family protein